MHISASTALWFLPFVLPVCLWVAWTDLKLMKILNVAVLTLVGVYVVIGPFALGLDAYLWHFLHLGLMLCVGIVMNAAGLIGAGDAKFVAAAAPFIAVGDVLLVLVILAASLLTGFAAHRIAKYTSLRKLAPNWESWSRGKKFPMGLCLGGTLAAYLVLGALYGA